MRCRQCGVPVTQALTELTDLSLLCEQDGEPYLPRGWITVSRPGNPYGPLGEFIVNLADLSVFDEGTIVDPAALIDKGFIPDLKLPVKVLGNGEVSKKLTIVAAWYSKSAFEKIGAAGGTAQDAKGEAFAFPKPKKKFIKRDVVKPARRPKPTLLPLLKWLRLPHRTRARSGPE